MSAEARVYCGCCKRKYPPNEVDAGICMDCSDGCWVGDCNVSGERQSWLPS